MARRNNPDSYSQRVQAARARAVDHCVAFFNASGVKYTCLSIVQQTVEPELARIATLDEYRPYNINTRNTLNKITDRVHAEWLAKQRVPS